ncbi:L-lysine 6-monooxygenase (NADPH-requiring)-domain-containing protein [Tricladium varicosporioides]|nr:L-lysine 6-monooxygenase (NADPH-requiring)-domain-containing protein [Hymenoscyphus varicosporioides]
MAQVQQFERSFPSPKKRIQRPATVTYDLVCVGFGPEGLALAAAIKDNNPSSNVLFLDQNESFPSEFKNDAEVISTSFLYDLATLRDPTSQFTFLNYLRIHGKLENFLAHSETVTAPSSDFREYIEWAAQKCADCVKYAQEVSRVSQISKSRWSITCRDMKTGNMNIVGARKVVFGSKEGLKIAKEENVSTVVDESEALQIFRATEAAKGSLSSATKDLSISTRYSQMCIKAVDVYNSIFVDMEPLFIRAML